MTYLILLHSKSSQFLVIQLSSKHWFCRLQEPEFRYGACLPPSFQNRIKTEFWKPCGWLLIYPALLLWNPDVMFKNTIKLGRDGSSNLGGLPWAMTKLFRLQGNKGSMFRKMFSTKNTQALDPPLHPISSLLVIGDEQKGLIFYHQVTKFQDNIMSFISFTLT